MIAKLFQLVMKILVKFVGFVLDMIFSLFGAITLPDFSRYEHIITDMWDTLFYWFNYARTMLCIDSFFVQTLVLILAIKFLHKPVIAITKWFIQWFIQIK